MFKAVLFDLDGTITDSAEGITKSVQYALQHFGMTVEDPRELTCFVGPSLYDQFQKYANLNLEQSKFAVQKFRERFSTIGIYENAVYPGIEQVLRKLKTLGIPMAIASSKPEVFVNQVLDHFQLRHYFDVVVGSQLDGSQSEKAEVIQQALIRLGLEKSSREVLMVGDRREDVQGARICGTTSLGVAYGYGGREELEEAGAYYIVNSIQELEHFFLTNPSPIPAEELYVDKMRRQFILFKIWRSLYPIVIHFSGAILAALVGGMIIMISLVSKNPGIDTKGLQDGIMRHSLLLTFIGQILVLPPLAYFYYKDTKRRQQVQTVKVFGEVKKFNVLQWIAIYVFSACVGLGLSNLIDLSGISSLFPAYGEIAEQVFENQNLLLSMVSVGIFAPLVEELAFRGLMYRRVKEYSNVTVGVLTSAFAFGVYHGNMVQFIFAFLLGIVMAYVYEETNTLWSCIMVHVGVNMTSTLLSEFMTNGYPNLAVFLLSTVVEIAVAILLGLYLWKLFKKKKGIAELGRADKLQM